MRYSPAFRGKAYYNIFFSFGEAIEKPINGTAGRMIRAEEKAAEREQSRKAGDAGKAGKQEPLGRGSKKGGKAFLPSSRRARI